MKKICIALLLLLSFSLLGCGDSHSSTKNNGEREIQALNTFKVLNERGYVIGVAHYITIDGKKFVIFEGRNSSYPLSVVEIKQ